MLELKLEIVDIAIAVIFIVMWTLQTPFITEYFWHILLTIFTCRFVIGTHSYIKISISQSKRMRTLSKRKSMPHPVQKKFSEDYKLGNVCLFISFKTIYMEEGVIMKVFSLIYQHWGEIRVVYCLSLMKDWIRFKKKIQSCLTTKKMIQIYFWFFFCQNQGKSWEEQRIWWLNLYR